LRRLIARCRVHAPVAGGAAAGLALLAWIGLADFAFNDYDTEASASVQALTAGHIGHFLDIAPAYGGSLAIRAPFALLPGLWGGGALAVYRMLALPCLLAVGALAVWVAARMRSLGKGRLARGATVALLAANPVVLLALQIGHPEEVLAGSLCVAALLVARTGRWAWAGALLGLAVGTKSWAVLAVLPVLVALPGGRGRALLLAGAIGGSILVPFAVAHQLHAAGGAAGSLGSASGPIFEPTQIWWWLGAHGIVRGGNGMIKAGFRVEPGWLSTIAHPLIVALAVPLTLLWRRRRRGRALEPLGLLTLLLLARCLLDPWNNRYYAVPFLLALITWESLSRREVPFASLAATLLTYVTFQELPGHVSPDVQSFFYLVWMVPLAAAMAAWLYAPAALARASRPRAGRLPDVEQLLGEAA
jgi:hypothetical protein